MAQKNTIVHTLIYPSPTGGVEMKEVEMRRPRRCRYAQGAEHERRLARSTTSMIVNLAEVSPQVVDE